MQQDEANANHEQTTHEQGSSTWGPHSHRISGQWKEECPGCMEITQQDACQDHDDPCQEQDQVGHEYTCRQIDIIAQKMPHDRCSGQRNDTYHSGTVQCHEFIKPECPDGDYLCLLHSHEQSEKHHQ